MILVALTRSSGMVVASSKANPDTAYDAQRAQTHSHYGASTGRSSVPVLVEVEDKSLVRRAVPLEARGVVAAHCNADPSGPPKPRGDGPEFHHKVEVLARAPLPSCQPPAEAPGHPEPRGVGRSGRGPVHETQAALGHVGHLTVRSDVLEIYVDRPVES